MQGAVTQPKPIRRAGPRRVVVHIVLFFIIGMIALVLR